MLEFLLVLGMSNKHSIVFVGFRVARRSLHHSGWFQGCQGNVPLFLLVLGLPEKYFIVFVSSRVARGEFHHFCQF